MLYNTPFESFEKIPRLRRTVTVTEKIDGTNAQIYIREDGIMLAGSRTRWITPEDDNFGFASWVKANEEELRKLGPGRHFGEWWGSGIQRNYGLKNWDKRFSLFNTARWTPETLPKCCHVVPVLAKGELDTSVEESLTLLRAQGSFAAPGFMKPEGVVVYHEASQQLFKVTLEKDEEPKGQPKRKPDDMMPPTYQWTREEHQNGDDK